MTKRQRRDKGTKNSSVITGLRLEPDVAQDLCTYARAHALDEHGRGDVAQMARFFIRTGLGWSPTQSNELEDRVLKPSRLCGLALETPVMLKLENYGRGLGTSAAARHLIRLGLGMADAESRQREERFAAMATALRDVRERFG